MCGLCGFVPFVATNADQLDASLRRMTSLLTHRGPDDAGFYVDPNSILGLGFRRLSIQDLSPAGHQPMVSASGRYIIVFNGEIYNFNELRTRINPFAWRGHSDTEVILALIDELGVEHTVTKLTGMFAFALWDKNERVLWLVRDRLGKKPLYYSITHAGLVFASELKALYPLVKGDLSISTDSLNTFLRIGYVPGHSTIYTQCFKLRAAHLLRISIEELTKSRVLPQPVPYWSLENVALSGQREAQSGNAATQEEFETLFDDAVSKRMIADVDLGAFLSGGIDSSLVVARMAALSSRAPRTFSIAFEESRWNEAPYARAIAKALGTHHTEMTVTPKDSLSVIPGLAATFDEPFADSSMIPTLIVCRMARRHVAVALSGDGGDELFGGYERYAIASKGHRWASMIPRIARCSLGRVLGLTLPLASALDLNAGLRRRLAALTKLMSAQPGRALFQEILTLTSEPSRFTRTDGELTSPEFGDNAAWLDQLDLRRQFMLADARGYLIDDILVKVDRTSMSTSLEVRAPLLDHRIVELAWRMRTADLYDGNRGKMPLRRALARQLPEHLFERPKMGFGVPVEEWLRGPLLDWAEALLNPARLKREGYFHEPAVTSIWRHYLRHREGWTHTLWCVLMFQAWLDSVESINTGSHANP